mgnify:CR=1 FL=1
MKSTNVARIRGGTDYHFGLSENHTKELEHDIDKHSKTLIATYIELLLGYCMRFYERQFITRSKSNRDVLTRFEQLLDEYFEGSAAERDGLPSVKHSPTNCVSHPIISETC